MFLFPSHGCQLKQKQQHSIARFTEHNWQNPNALSFSFVLIFFKWYCSIFLFYLLISKWVELLFLSPTVAIINKKNLNWTFGGNILMHLMQIWYFVISVGVISSSAQIKNKFKNLYNSTQLYWLEHKQLS